MMKHNLPILLLATCLWACNSPETVQNNSEQLPPNIIIVFTDDLGYGDLGCYGQSAYSTPHLDQMAAEGIRFTNFYAAQPVCSASRAGLLTGCYPNRVGVSGAFGPSSPVGLSPEETTLAEMLRQQGYKTAALGKWHLGHQPEFLPTNQGFDQFFGIPYSNDMWPKHPNNEAYQFPELPLMEGTETLRYLTENQDSLTTWLTFRALDFISQHKEKPFFLYLAHPMPHVPLYVSDRFRDKSGAGLYGDVILEIDWSVGEIMAALKKHGIEENTLLIFTSDNGPWLSYGTHGGSAGPLREGKLTTWEGGVRVPFIAKWPGKIPQGTEQAAPAVAIDLLPTLASWTGATLPEKTIDGKNIAPLLLGEPNARSPQMAYFFYFKQNDLQAVLSGDGRWKLCFPHNYQEFAGLTGRDDGLPVPYNNGRLEEPALFDLLADPGETTDLFNEQPEVVQQLMALADSMRHELGDNLQEVTGTARRPLGRIAE